MGVPLRRWVLLCCALWGLWPLAASSQTAEAPRSLTLKDALGMAWKANPSLQVSRLGNLIAEQDVVRARSGFLPKVKSDFNQTVYDQATKIRVPAGGTSVSFPLTNNNFWYSKLSVDQTIFDFWATHPATRRLSWVRMPPVWTPPRPRIIFFSWCARDISGCSGGRNSYG